MISPGMCLQERYLVVRELGKGGFGQTFEVRDGDTLKVLKVLHNTSPKAVSLFKREAAVLKQLNYPGIPKIEPAGYFVVQILGNIEPKHCLVMEKVDGSSLEEWLNNKNNQLTSSLALGWLKQLVEILERVHQHEFFHRDIKPANIMLKPNGQLVLIDFGAVKEVTNTYLIEIAAGRSITNCFSGGYTPLEQIEGKAVPQSDFFALARTFVHLLTGQHPYDLPKDPQNQLVWRNKVPTMSVHLANLIDWMMAPFPGQRPQNTQVILQHLAALTGDRPVLMIPTSQGVLDKPKPAYFSRVTFGVAGLLLVGFIGLRLALPKLAIALNDKGRENYSVGRKEFAQLYFDWAVRLNPQYFAAYYNQGVICEERGNFDCARNKYQVAAQGGFAKAYNNLGRLYIILEKDCKTAVPLLEEGLNEAEDDDELKSALLKNLGKCRH